MTLRYCLDTNVLSEPLRPNPDAGLLRRLWRHQAACAVPAPVWHELVFGLARLGATRRADTLRDYLYTVVRPTLAILPYDDAAAEWHGRERARQARLGRPSPYADAQIAAVAASNELVLVTANVRDFAGFEGLRVEDWRTG